MVDPQKHCEGLCKAKAWRGRELLGRLGGNGRPGDKRTEQFIQTQEQDMAYSAVMAAAFNVPAVIFHDPLEMPVQKGTVVPQVLWSKEARP